MAEKRCAGNACGTPRGDPDPLHTGEICPKGDHEKSGTIRKEKCPAGWQPWQGKNK